VSAVRAKARVLGLFRRNAPKCAAHTRQPELAIETLATRATPTDLVPRSRNGRAIWTDTAIDNLAELWKRLLSPRCIATLLDLKPSAVSEAARRSGLPNRAGLPLLKTVPAGDPFSLPENLLVSSEMIRKICPVRGGVFFVRPKNRRTEHVSFLGRLGLAKSSAGAMCHA